MKIILVLFITLQINYIYPSNLPSPFRCSVWDSPCVTPLTQNPNKGFILRIPEVDTLKLLPLQMDYLKLDLNGLIFETKDTKIYGLKDLVIDEFSADSNTSTVNVKFSTNLLVTGLYRCNGYLFYIPMYGQGDYLVSLKNVVVDVLAPYTIVKDVNGEEFIRVEAKDYKISYDVKDNAQFRLNNLYYGIPGFSDLMHYLINANWKYVTSQYASAFIGKAIENVAKAQSKSYFRLDPVDFLPQ